MQKKFCLAFTLTLVCYWAESSPANLGALEFDKLDTDLDDLKYEIEEEDLDEFSKLLEDADGAAKIKTNASDDKAKSSVNASGFKKKNTANKGLKATHNIQDLKKFYKGVGVDDKGSYNDDGVYAVVEGLAATAVGVKGNEDRKYRKGTKTRGFHRVHHKDEYKKDKIYYEDDEINGNIKKVGEKTRGFKLGAGVGFNKGHFHHDRQKGIYGKEGVLDKGIFDKEFRGYADAQGFDGSFTSES